VKLPKFTISAFVACAALAITVAKAEAQTIYTWNNTGTNFSSAGSWSPTGGPPTSTDTIQFTPGGSPYPTGITQPTIDADMTVKTVILAPAPDFGGWTFSGSKTLSVNFPGGVNAYGPATYRFDGPAVQGNGAVNQLFNITNGSTVMLTGNSTVPANAGIVDLHGGTLVLDNSINNSSSRLPLLTSSFNMQSGTIELRGSTSAATSFALSLFTTTSGSGGATGFIGTNTIRLVPGGGGQLSANFSNNGISGATFTTLFATTGIFRFETTSGVLGGPGSNDPKVTFTGSPALGANGLFGAADNSSSFGNVIVSDANGTDFATWTASAGVKAAGATLTSANATGAGSISSGTANDRVFYTPGGTSQSATGTITNGSLRIAPTATGGTLAMGANNLQTVALMLEGNKDFTISGTGILGNGLSPRYIYVNDPNSTLTTSLVINSGLTTVIAGPGFVALSGTVSQNTGTTGTTRLVGGTLRANNTQLGFTSSGNGTLIFSGGVLEMTGGTFSRNLNASSGAGRVRWEGGNGGFSAFGATSTVNLGGGSAGVTWGSGGFVGDGYALTFGSTKSNATIVWQNPIELGAPANGSYALREFKVTSGAGTLSDVTVLAAGLTGGANADLIKTGNGVLELDSLNSYQGNTLVQSGTLIVNGNLGDPSGNKGGNIVVGRGAVLAGWGTLNPSQDAPSDPKSVIVNPGGAIRGGTPVTSAAGDHTGTLTINSSVIINSTASDRGTLQFEAHRTGVGTADVSKIVLGAGYNLNLNPGAGNKFAIELVKTAPTTSLDLNQQYTLTLASVGVGGHIQLNGANIAGGTTIDPSNYTLISSAYAFDSSTSLQVLGSDETGYDLSLTFKPVPVPEPAAIIGISAAMLCLGARLRMRSRGAAIS
jgi:fibronectin-binding autotransporter adhesin